MELYSIVLFVHVMAAIGLFVGLAVEGFISVRVVRAADLGQMKFFLCMFDRLRWIFIPAFAGILLGGLYLAFPYGRGTFWIPAALIATLAIMTIGGLLTGRRMARLKKSVGGAAVPLGDVSARALGRGLALSYGLRVGLALGIVFLMTVKPGAWPSGIALLIGCVAGLGIASAMRKVLVRTDFGCGFWDGPVRPTPDAPVR